MSGFVKIWTDILHDSWVQGLSLSEKGLWVWLITMTKEAGDTGQISFPSWRGLGVQCGCDGKTAEKILRKFRTQNKIELVENDNGTIAISIPNYLYYQLLKRPGRKEPRAEKSTKNPHQEPSQSRADQIRPDKTKSEQIKPEQIRPEQSRADYEPKAPVVEKRQLTPEGEEVILNAYFKKFQTGLNADCLHTLLYGNSSFEGYDSASELLFALNNLRVNKPGAVENPVGLLIDFHKNPEKYLSDSAYADWKRLNYARQTPTGSSLQMATPAGEIIRKIMRNLESASAGR